MSVTLYSRVTHLHIYIYILFHYYLSQDTLQLDLVVYSFCIYQFASANPKLPVQLSLTPASVGNAVCALMSLILFLAHR